MSATSISRWSTRLIAYEVDHRGGELLLQLVALPAQMHGGVCRSTR